MASRIPSPLSSFCRGVLPTISRTADGRRTLSYVEQIVHTDRWNSFDRFGDTTDTLTNLYDAAGVPSEVYTIGTGGPIGTGRWIIAEAADIAGATLEVTAPVRQRVVDYRENPWQVIQWSAATPRGGVTCELAVIDTAEGLAAAGEGTLTGKMILTRLPTYDNISSFARTGAVGVIADSPVKNLPGATRWTKFGWGGIGLEHAGRRLVGLALSGAEGDRLRQLIATHGTLTVRARVDIRHYVGSHDMVSGLVRGGADPESEVWALSHSAEPGAVDNASGVASCIEIARLLEDLIQRGKLPRPRRTIRLLSGYECYSFFHYLEHQRRFQTPLAGVCLDGVGTRPQVCNGRLHWHSTIAMSAGFVDRLGMSILREALKLRNPGYRLHAMPFVSTCDTLIGDPKFGFPCPWLNAHWKGHGRAYDAYHTSYDTPDLLSASGMATCTAAMAGYLYYLANAGNAELLEMAHTETKHATRQLKALAKRDTPLAAATFVRDQHHASMDRLARWVWGGDRSSIARTLGEMERVVAETGSFAKPRRRVAPAARRVPRRTAPLTPQLQNTPAPIARTIRESKVRDWTLMWADGQRNLAEIADAARCDLGVELSDEQISAFFEAHRELGYVEFVEPEAMVSKAALVADLKRLGLRAGMDVICHSSLSQIGHVVGGADAVIDAMIAVIGKRGTLMAPTFNFGRVKLYNPATTPGLTGAVGETMRQRPDAVRSDHPTHPVVAIGAKAEAFCQDHTDNGIWSADSPIGRLIHADGYILSLGVGQIYSTAYHVAEVSMPCTGLDSFAERSRVVDADGQVKLVASMAYRATSCPVPPNEIGKLLDRKDLRLHGTVGRAKSTLVRALDLYETRRAQLRRACPTCTVKPTQPENQAK